MNHISLNKKGRPKSYAKSPMHCTGHYMPDLIMHLYFYAHKIVIIRLHSIPSLFMHISFILELGTS